MPTLQKDFKNQNGHVVDLNVPPLVMDILNVICDITKVDKICIAGGFPRGLYMQQKMGLSPQMNDIDIFADFPTQQEGIKKQLIKKFGPTIRTNLGIFDDHKTLSGQLPFRELIEFNIPESLRPQFANAQSIQFNFGINHPFANPYDYINLANVGINQIAMTEDGTVMASNLFMQDMANKTITMNPHRSWTPYNWKKNTRTIKRNAKRSAGISRLDNHQNTTPLYP